MLKEHKINSLVLSCRLRSSQKLFLIILSSQQRILVTSYFCYRLGNIHRNTISKDVLWKFPPIKYQEKFTSSQHWEVWRDQVGKFRYDITCWLYWMLQSFAQFALHHSVKYRTMLRYVNAMSYLSASFGNNPTKL